MMLPLRKSICVRNIANYRRQLDKTRDKKRRDLLLNLLADEEAVLSDIDREVAVSGQIAE